MGVFLIDSAEFILNLVEICMNTLLKALLKRLPLYADKSNVDKAPNRLKIGMNKQGLAFGCPSVALVTVSSEENR